MKFDIIRRQIEGIPFMSPEQGRIIYDFLLEHRPAECVELGFAHGVSTCYMAAALDELGAGHITAVDVVEGLEWQKPSLEELLERTGLGRYVTIVREQTSYNWFLKKKIEERTSGATCEPLYDFCFLDGSKNWTIDGLAFFLVDKLLREGGWILFDDLNWTYRDAGAAGSTWADDATLRRLGRGEIDTPHLDRIFRLLVMQHPDYSEFRIQDDWWGWAHKVKGPSKRLEIDETTSARKFALNAIRRVGKAFAR